MPCSQRTCCTTRNANTDVNPVAVTLIGLGLLLIVVGFRNNQDNLIATATGKPYGKSTLR